MIELDKTALLGIDVGFSKSKPTTGIAWSVKNDFGAARTHSDWERRRQHIPASTQFSVIAIDGPIVPIGSDDGMDRLCERLFIRGAFQTRCKPGLSNHGYGKDLRRAAAETVDQVLHLAMHSGSMMNAIRKEAFIIEAFPNAFLGVLLPEARFALPKAGKRKKFDWLYDHAVDSGVISELFHKIGWHNPQLITVVLEECDHEKRAAWICLLTAACAATGKSEVVGDDLGGWFWLPPIDQWARWAREALKESRSALA
ncbi:DUF429 domain-containing protein [Brucella rhizosphaerae]|uniref:DUF429 domain-containing protein n=1 Tax=Brucella rhizosphaerae TaxID=571254 RepID=UPI000465728F|nr:DUF429 domain-containing protein [Brucella rhizosphaerae]